MLRTKKQMTHTFTVNQFDDLEEALIDASSLIYAEKAGFLRQLQQILRLYTLSKISEEANIKTGAIYIVQKSYPASLSPDQQLVACAIESGLPVISDDKKILRRIQQANLPYYNALMMINFLLFHRKITLQEYQQHYSALRKIARYSPQVWEFGESVHWLIRQSCDDDGNTDENYSKLRETEHS